MTYFFCKNIAVTNHGVTKEDGVVSRDCVHEVNIICEDMFVSFIIFLYLILVMPQTWY